MCKAVHALYLHYSTGSNPHIILYRLLYINPERLRIAWAKTAVRFSLATMCSLFPLIAEGTFEAQNDTLLLRFVRINVWTLSRYISVCIAEARDISLSHRIVTGSEAYPTFCPMSARGSFPGLNLRQREADYSPSTHTYLWRAAKIIKPIKLKTPWSEPASELYRPSDRRLSAKWLPTFCG
jgi:hypothetical protein